MAKYLVIVESPAKVKTIRKFLGSGYEVMASNGHVRDLPKSRLGIDVDKDYEPKYITIRGKGDLLANLRKEVKKAEKIYLATDPDREGEAIAWHLCAALKLEAKKLRRITFNEITKTAVKESLKKAREINMGLVDAQQARRCLDRMVGYRISPLLWAKVKRGLSAGRVQSVALRMICDREEEINAFIPEEYWTLDAALKVGKKPVTARFYGTKEGKLPLPGREAVENVVKELNHARFLVEEVKTGERVKKAPLPFTTSTLQQEASKALNFSTQKTMRLAQQLYEGVDIKGNGTVGVITYLRTDSARVSQEAARTAADYIGKHYGEAYVGQRQEGKKDSRKIQDAHEAIRPTDVSLTPQALKASLSREQFRLYQLIWKRFVASRMSDALYETLSVKIEAAGYRFTLSAGKLKFEGFRSVYIQDEEEKEEDGGPFIGQLAAGEELPLAGLLPGQHFTQPVPHYTEASLVRALEEQGIGRPSTYAPTITTILARRYIAKENRNLYVTELGEVVNQMMKEAFPSIVDVRFTANMETLLDGVEEGEIHWKTLIRNFYPDLDEAVVKADRELKAVELQEEFSGEDCELCGRPMYVKYGPHGRFQACSGFPECRSARPYYEKIGVSCPKCGKDVVIKKTRKGRRYYGCIDNPECGFMAWQRPSGGSCGKCGGALLEKGGKLVCANPECANVTVRGPQAEL